MAECGNFLDISRDELRHLVGLAIGRVERAHDLCDDDIADKFGVDRKTIWAWRNGESDIKALQLFRLMRLWPDEFAAVKALICGVAK